MLPEIAFKIQEIVAAETAVVVLAENNGEIAHYAAAVGKYAPQIVGLKGDATTSGLCGSCFAGQCSVLVEKTAGDGRVRQDYVQAWGITSALAVPLIYEGQLLGAFLAFNRQDGKDFNSELEQKLVAYRDSVVKSFYDYLRIQSSEHKPI